MFSSTVLPQAGGVIAPGGTITAEDLQGLMAAIVDGSDDAIISKTLEGVITSWNAAATRIFGYTAEEAVGKPVTILFPYERLHEEPIILGKIRSGERIDHYETVRLRKDGTPLDVSLTVSPVRDSSGKLIGVSKIARDITEQRRAQRALARQNERLELLSDAAAHLLAAEEPESMVRGLFQRVRGHLGIDTYINFMVDKKTDELVLLSAAGIGDAEKDLTHIGMGQAICGTVAVNRRGFVVPRLQESSDPRADWLKKLGIRTYVCNPLAAGHRLLGTLGFGSRTRDKFEPDELEFIRTLCHYVSIAWERHGLVEQLRAVDRRKDEFIATLAHELRNPLAPIRNSIEILRNRQSEGEKAEGVYELLDRQTRQLTRLVDDLMEVSRITSGKVLLRRETVDLSKVIQHAVDTSRPLIEKGRHQLTVTAPPGIYADVDPVRMAQVLVNLLNNAAKYTEEGGQVALTLERQGNQAVIAVKDNGLGIPAEMLPRVFDMFTQIDRNLARSQGGLGIGLSLAKRLIELHGGRIEARSEGAGNGSQFVVRLPTAEPAEAAARMQGHEKAHGARSGRRRVLVVDDNMDAANSLAHLLQTFDHVARVAFDGRAALEVAGEFRPDVVLMDIGMPEMDGYETARRLRELPEAGGAMLVALTGWGQEDDRRRAKEAGFEHHFTKPVNIEGLLELLGAEHGA